MSFVILIAFFAEVFDPSTPFVRDTLAPKSDFVVPHTSASSAQQSIPGHGGNSDDEVCTAVQCQKPANIATISDSLFAVLSPAYLGQCDLMVRDYDRLDPQTTKLIWSKQIKHPPKFA